jgi:hypothetical protein
LQYSALYEALPSICFSTSFSMVKLVDAVDALVQEKRRAEQKGDWGGINKFLNRLLVRLTSVAAILYHQQPWIR